MALADAGDEAPRRAQILGDRALALGGLGHHEEAIAEAEQALALAPESAELQSRAGLRPVFRRPACPTPSRRSSGRWSSIPTFTPALRTLALAQTAAGKGDEAVELLQRALRQNPLDRDAVLQLSFLHIEPKQFAEALAAAGALSQGSRPTMCARSTTRAWRCAA